METNVPARVLWQLQTLSIKGESEVLSLSKEMSMTNNNSQSWEHAKSSPQTQQTVLDSAVV